MYFNVPRGYDLLLPYLEQDAALRRNFFKRPRRAVLRRGVVAAEPVGPPQEPGEEENNTRLTMLSAWGSTETSPLATSVHFPMERPGVIGLPVAGCELKLVPAAGKLEVRVRGPHVTPGYYERPDLTQAAFDEEGFYRIGDAVKLAEPGRSGRTAWCSTAASPRTSSSPPAPGCTSARCACS